MAKTATVHKLEFVNRDRGYRWQERDPEMETICDLIDKSGMDVLQICREVTKVTGGAYSVHNSTIYGWLNGKTKRPQNYTLTWVGYALGYERRWTKVQ